MKELISHDINVDKFLSGSDLAEVIKVTHHLLRYKIRASKKNLKIEMESSKNSTNYLPAASQKNLKAPKVTLILFRLLSFPAYSQKVSAIKYERFRNSHQENLP